MESIILKLCRCGYVSWSKKSEILSMLEREISMPWSGLDRECCENLKRNNGLYTQCMNKKWNGGDCKGCVSVIEKNGGVSKYGRVSDRLKVGIMDYIDPSSGKRVSRYSDYMKKNNLTREDVERYGKMMGVEIEEIHFEEGEEKKKRGRPKKEVGEEKVGEKKKRGRPKKEKQVVSNGAGEDLIASLLEESRDEKKMESDMENEKEKKMESDMESDMENEKEKKMESDMENEKEKKMESDMENEKEKKMECDMENDMKSEVEEDEEETVVIKFDIKGVTYLKSSDNVLYDMSSHDVVGIWNEETSEIEEVCEESEDEEE